MVIRTLTQLKKLSTNTDIILIPISGNSKLSPLMSNLSILYYYNISTAAEYLIIINYPDFNSTIKLNDLMYLYNSEFKIYTPNKKTLIQLGLNFSNIYDIQLAKYINLAIHLLIDNYNTTAHKLSYKSITNYLAVNHIIPIYKHLEYCQRIKDKILKLLPRLDFTNPDFESFNNKIILTFIGVEQAGIKVDTKIYNKHFKNKLYLLSKDNLLYSNYQFDTQTGRPSNSIQGINLNALNKETGIRNLLISRFGSQGSILELDFSGYHIALLADLINYPLEGDPHKVLASYYHNTNTPTAEQIEQSKIITFTQIYGGISSQYKHIEFFKQVEIFADILWKQFDGSYLPLIGRRVRNIKNKYHLLSFIIQNLETKTNAEMLDKVLKYLETKSTKLILYLYDSFIFDYNSTDGIELIQDLKKIFTTNNNFSVHIKQGLNYGTLQKI